MTTRGYFAQKAVMITGAANGVGKALAMELAQRGARIAAIDFDAAALDQLAQELLRFPIPHALAVGDVTSLPSMQAAASRLSESLGTMDMLIANAGIGMENGCVPFDPVIFRKQIEVNLIGVANSAACVIPGMLRQRSGHVIALSSLASYRGLPLMSGYCASKAGVSAMMDSFRVELAPYGIHCTTICPGWIRTRLTNHFAFPMPDMLSLESAVKRMIRAIERKQPYVAFPPRSHWPLTLNRLLPTTWGDAIMKWVLRRQGLTKGI